MAKVGEMVNRRIAMQARQGRGGVANQSDSDFRLYTAPIQALQSLGIWDAEVQVCKVYAAADGTDGVKLYPNMKGLQKGNFVRLIVLKKEK